MSAHDDYLDPDRPLWPDDEIEVDPGFENFIAICEKFLLNYPPDIFTGESGDPGPVFVADLRRALEKLNDGN